MMKDERLDGLMNNKSWLSYSGQMHGVPKDWAVYRDVIKKIVQRYQSKIDSIEV